MFKSPAALFTKLPPERQSANVDAMLGLALASTTASDGTTTYHGDSQRVGRKLLKSLLLSSMATLSGARRCNRGVGPTTTMGLHTVVVHHCHKGGGVRGGGGWSTSRRDKRWVVAVRGGGWMR